MSHASYTLSFILVRLALLLCFSLSVQATLPDLFRLFRGKYIAPPSMCPDDDPYHPVPFLPRDAVKGQVELCNYRQLIQERYSRPGPFDTDAWGIPSLRLLEWKTRDSARHSGYGFYLGRPVFVKCKGSPARFRADHRACELLNRARKQFKDHIGRHHVSIPLLAFAFSNAGCLVLPNSGTKTLTDHAASFREISSDHTGTLPDQMIRMMITQLAYGLDFIHSAGLAMSDLKGDNVMVQLPLYGSVFPSSTPSLLSRSRTSISATHYTIIDFDFAVELKQPLGTHQLYTGGTIGFMSPEMALSSHIDMIKHDVWTLAMTLMQAVDGRTAYEVPEEFSMSQAMKLNDECMYELDDWKEYRPTGLRGRGIFAAGINDPDSSLSLLRGANMVDSEKRVSLATIIKGLELGTVQLYRRNIAD